MTLLDAFQRPNRRRIARPCRPRVPAISLFCAGTLMLGVALAIAPTVGAPNEALETAGPQGRTVGPAGAADGSAQPEDRIREGTELVDQPGSFRPTGDRIAFFTDVGKGRLVVLENLALERVRRSIEDTPTPPEWIVTGTVTEYRGENFLFVRRAVLRDLTTN